MLYVSGIFALNLPCSLNTDGDWHTSALNWKNVKLLDSDKMFFKDYGIERNKTIPEHDGAFCVANHIRALLDLMEQGNFAVAQGMRRDFIDTDEYDDEIFEKVKSMKSLANWEKIDAFMRREYLLKWVNFLAVRFEKSKTDSSNLMPINDLSIDDVNAIFYPYVKKPLTFSRILH